MRYFPALCIVLVICGCSSDVDVPIKSYHPKVEIYQLKSFTTGIYTGMFRPSYLSSIILSMPYIDPLSATNKLTIEFPTIIGAGYIQPPDKRNDFVLMYALSISGRLKS